MRIQLLILAIACSFAVACGPSKKAQTPATSSNSIASNTGNTSKPNAKPGEYVLLDDETYLLSGLSDDATYGYSAKNAIKVGNGSMRSGPASERAFLNALKGPNGEKVSYARKGSCCGVESAYAPLGVAMLDLYEVKYKGLGKPIMLYINMYDPGVLLAPKGFTFRQ